MALVYVQTIYAEDVGLKVQYETLIPTNSPPATTPVSSGPYQADSHTIVDVYDDPNRGGSGTGGTPVPVPYTGTLQQVVTAAGETLLGSLGVFDPTKFGDDSEIIFTFTALLSTPTDASANILLYDMGAPGTPEAGTLITTLTIPNGSVGSLVTSTANIAGSIEAGPRVYEIRAEIIDFDPGDLLTVEHSAIIATGNASGGGGGGGEVILWEWNGVDDTQFVDNPLPGPSFFSGVSVDDAQLNIVAQPSSPSQFSIELSANEIINGSAVWWITDTVDLADIKEIQFSLGVPNPGPDPSTVEQVGIGFVFGADDVAGTAIVDWINLRGDGVSNLTLTHQVLMTDTDGPTYNMMYDDLYPSAGYFLNITSKFEMDRNNAAYDGAPGVPNGWFQTVTSAWSPGSTSGASLPHGGTVLFNTALFAPGPSWSTSACNRIGLVFGGGWQNANSGSQVVALTQFKIIGKG